MEKRRIEAQRLRHDVLSQRAWTAAEFANNLAIIAGVRKRYPVTGSELFEQEVERKLGFHLANSVVYTIDRIAKLYHEVEQRRKDFFNEYNCSIQHFEEVSSAVVRTMKRYPAGGSELIAKQVRDMVRGG